MARSSELEPSGRLIPAPRANPDLFGHVAAENALRRLFEAGRLPHALLLSGPRGIGKATLAFRLARFVLSRASESAVRETEEGLAVPPENGVFRRVAAGGHADLLTVERAWDPRRRRLRGEIVVDDTREISAFFRLTSAEGGWRIVIIDGADEMNRNAANALLKILEEPPQRALLLLVAHSPGRLLPTIRSRCRRFPLSPLAPDTLRVLLARYRPELDHDQAEAVAQLAAGSIGRTLDLVAADGVELYRSMLGLLARPQGLDPLALHVFADRLARPDAEDSYRAVEELLGQLLARFAKSDLGHVSADQVRMPPPIAAPENAAVERLGRRAPPPIWAELRDRIGESFSRTDALNLDRKQTLLGAFFAIERAAG